MIGGMISSLLHILIVTPVIFFWLRMRNCVEWNRKRFNKVFDLKPVTYRGQLTGTASSLYVQSAGARAAEWR